MNKEEFITKLKKKINILEQSEIDDIISEYEGYIEEKMSSGMDEKEAVESLGNINEIAKDLLGAYKIKDDYKDSNKNIIKTVMDKIIYYIDLIIKYFENKSFGDVVKMLIKIFLLVILIRICKLPFDLFLSVIRNTIIPFNNSLGNYLYYLFKVIINLIYIILAVIFFFRVLSEKILDKDLVGNIKERKDKNEGKKETKDKPVIKESNNKKGIIDLFTDIVIIFIKFIVSILTISDAFFIVGITAALAIDLYLIMKGVTYFGILFIILSLLIFGICFIDLFIRFIFDQKQHIKLFIISLLISLIVGGIGVGIFTTEIANTEIIKTQDEKETQTYIEKMDMRDNLVLSNYYNTNYITDESLENEIKIEYKYYFDYLDFEPSHYESDSEGYVIYHFNYSASWNKKRLNKIINDLKAKKIYYYDDIVEVNIYTSSKNIDTLKNNEKKYEELSFELYDEDCYYNELGEYLCE